MNFGESICKHMLVWPRQGYLHKGESNTRDCFLLRQSPIAENYKEKPVYITIFVAQAFGVNMDPSTLGSVKFYIVWCLLS